MKYIRETIKNEAKEQKGGFLGMLLKTLWASLLGNLLTEELKKQLEHVKEQLGQVRIFRTVSSFNKL